MKRSYTIFTVLFSALIMITSCTSVPVERNNRRLSSFTVSDRDNQVVQKVEISYNESDKPINISTYGPDNRLIGNKMVIFTAEGKMSSLTYNDGEGNLLQQSSFTYDDNNFLIATVTKDGRGQNLMTVNYRNDKRGNPVEWSSERRGEVVHFLMDYDSENRLIKSTELDGEGNRIYYSTTEYDDKGNEAAFSIFSSEGELDQQQKNHFKEGRLNKTELIDSNGQVFYTTVYQRDLKGLLTEKAETNLYGNTVSRTVYEYDDLDREIIVTKYGTSDEVTEKIYKSYDDEDNITLLKIEDGQGNLISSTRNIYENAPLSIDKEEFSTLVFNN